MAAYRPRRRYALVGLLLIATIALTAGGCGGSKAAAPSQPELEAAQRRGEEKARVEAKVEDLQKQVRGLRRQVKSRPPAGGAGGESQSSTAAPGPPPSEAAARSFHSPSGNVSCQVLADEATCSVASIGESFVLPAGESGRIEEGLRLEAGLGELAPYGSTVALGSVVCEVPSSDVPRGISCYDSQSGHGFEASRIAERQKTY